MEPVSSVRRHVLDACTRLTPRQIPIADAAGHVLALEVTAAHDVPPFANSAMDGFALHATDTNDAPVELRVVGAVLAGEQPRCAVGPGEAMLITTGAPLPPGADAVCMVERTSSERDGWVRISDSVEQGSNVRRAGEDVVAGTQLFAKGTYLSPAHVGVLASVGVADVVTYPVPRVAVLSTGDELQSAPGPLGAAKIRDSNGPALCARLRADGFDPIWLGAVGDDEASITGAIEDGSARADAIVVSGGVSVGRRDLVKVVLEKLSAGTMRWFQVAVKPAKPFAFGTLVDTSTAVFGLPGNPVSALVSYELFARPALRSMAGHSTIDRPRLTATCALDMARRPDGKLYVMTATVTVDGAGELQVRPSGAQRSHIMTSMASANALAFLPDGEGARCGDRVDVILLDLERLQDCERTSPW